MSRYIYLLGTLPAEVIEKAHAAAFRELSARERREMFDRLRPFMSEQEQEQAHARRPQPALMAGMLRRLSAANGGTTAVRDREGATAVDDPRRAFEDSLQVNAITAAVAHNFILSAVVVSYFASGAGAATLSGEPEWVSDLAASDPAGAGYGGGSYGGYDGGGAAGGYDGGGFIGGFDGGGGFA
ncbi:MAG: hypothetical protein DI573_10940 [Microbacterium sp.]|nr:MAG: hypothetical protein DI573_10940 [Microbacterium sp.]